MKTIVVTGANRGIGLEICRQLDKMGHTVILGSRNLEKGLEAVGNFSKNVIVKQLDVTNEESIQCFYAFVEANQGKLDVLINNAGVGANFGVKKNAVSKVKSYMEKNIPGVRQLTKAVIPVLRNAGIVELKADAESISLMNVKEIMETNFYGPWRMIQVFIPLLQKSEGGRIINISSGMGQLGGLTGEYSGYSISKSSLNALTIMFSNELKSKGIKVNAICPGWVKTAMGGPNAPREVSEGADTAVWLATTKEISNGKFFRDRKELNW